VLIAAPCLACPVYSIPFGLRFENTFFASVSFGLRFENTFLLLSRLACALKTLFYFYPVWLAL
jgi:hypothetical protein